MPAPVDAEGLDGGLPVGGGAPLVHESGAEGGGGADQLGDYPYLLLDVLEERRALGWVGGTGFGEPTRSGNVNNVMNV